MLPTPDLERFLNAALLASAKAGEIHRRFFRRADLAVEQKEDGTPVTRSDRLAEEAIREVLRRATPELGCLGEEYGQEGSATDRWIVDPLDGTKNFVAGLPYFAVLLGLELGGELTLGLVHAPALGPGAGVGALGELEGERDAGETWWAARGHGAWAGGGTWRKTVQTRRMAVSKVTDVHRAFVTHGGLRRLEEAGMWNAFSDLVRTVGRTRGFGDWWGHILVAEGRCDAMVEARVALHDVAPIKVIVEEAGGAFHTRGNVPLVSDFNDAVLSVNAHLGPELMTILRF